MADDRISQLPIPILHQILYFLCQEEAVRTCVLSKQWRHIGSTRLNLDFSQERFGKAQVKFVSVVDRILQEYRDQNLSIHKLHLHIHISRPDSRPVISLLDKWIPMIPALNIKVLKLNFLSYAHDLPSAVLLAESLEELHLRKCTLSPVESVLFKSLRTLTLQELQLRKCTLSPVESVLFKSLRTLTLEWVDVDGGTFETKTLGCPLLRRLVINNCWELRNVRLSETPGLKHFVLRDYTRIEGRSIEIDVPNIETVYITGPWIWSHRQSALLFSRLTSLDLQFVILSSESFDMLSFGCPTLESLTLNNCSGFKELHLASDSVKFLHICTTEILLKGVRISAPNIVSFEFIARISQVPDTFSFTTTTSKEWSSKVFLSSYMYDPDLDLNSLFLKLRRVLKALSGSRISLYLQMDDGPRDVPRSAVLGDELPVVVLNLIFGTYKCRTVAWHMGFMNGLFRVCRPSHVYGCWVVSKSGRNYWLLEFQLNILLANKKVRTRTYFWRHDLEQVFVESFDGKQWQLIQWRTRGELQKRTLHKNIRLRLKWRC